MDFKINFKPDHDYYAEAYSEIINSSRLKKFEPLFALIMITFSIGLWHYDNQNKLGFFSVLFGAFGIYELIKFYLSRHKWINDRINSGIRAQELSLHFTSDHIIHSGPFSNGNIQWAGIKSIIETQKGLILKPENGTVIYLPKKIFKNQAQIDFVINKIPN